MFSIGTAVIAGPSEFMYQHNEGPMELSCVITKGVIGWQVNGGETFSVGGIRDDGRLPGHTVNGTNLVIVKATNNTKYVCVSITNDGDIFSDPVYLYAAGMLIVSLHLVYCCVCTYFYYILST